MVMIFGALAGYFFVLPQWRRVTDEQVALYLEECEPTLETAILSALEAEKGSSSHSPELARRLVEQAIERCGAIERGRRLEAQPLRRYAAAIAGTIAAALLLFVLGPVYLRQGASALLLMAGDVLEASPYRINVKPGSTTVPRGSDQVIVATIQGFESDKAELLIRKSINAQFEHIPMVFNNDTKTFEGMLFDLPGSIDYFVESGGVRVGRVHDARGRSAVREAARDGIRVPGLHGPRAAQDRKRRRHRGAAGHAGARAHHADDEVALGPHPARRRHGDRRSRPTETSSPARFPSPRTASIASSCRAVPRTSSSTRRRSTRSTCSKTRRRPCRLRSPAGTRRRRPSKSSRSKRAPTTTSACGSSSWCTR